jgi:predicted O-methyltransferase YrrM
MTHLWNHIVQDLGLSERKESEVHPHAPEERAELFRAADGGSTEYEYLNLIHALVLAAKPLLVLETGTFRGYGTLALASALHSNGLGELITVDQGGCSEAKTLLQKYGMDMVRFVQSDSVQFCAQWTGDPFNLVFHDSGMSVRHRENDILQRRGKLAPQALAIFHDASPLRYGVDCSWELIQYLNQPRNGLAFNLSRGLRIVQF